MLCIEQMVGTQDPSLAVPSCHLIFPSQRLLRLLLSVHFNHRRFHIHLCRSCFTGRFRSLLVREMLGQVGNVRRALYVLAEHTYRVDTFLLRCNDSTHSRRLRVLWSKISLWPQSVLHHFQPHYAF